MGDEEKERLGGEGVRQASLFPNLIPEQLDTTAEPVERPEEPTDYAEWLEKFDAPKTTDDCYTPPLVYAALLDWAVAEFGLEGERVMRPFYPGGDYTKEGYSGDCVVIDNPPFSILTEICTFYTERGIRYLLFCPSLTAFSTVKDCCIFDGGNLVTT